MQFLVSTTGTNVLIKDLGIYLEHPTVDRDLSEDFTTDELANSAGLTAEVQAGVLTLKVTSADGTLETVDAEQYSSSVALRSDAGNFLPSAVVTTEELAAKTRTTLAIKDVFPVALSSTTGSTNVVVANSATFIDWRIAPSDVLYITNNGTNDGYFTVSEIIDQKKLVTAEALSTTNDVGDFYIFHPPGATKVGAATESFSVISGNNLQELLASIDSNIASGGSGITADEVGEVVYSTDGTTVAARVPLVSTSGWLVTDSGQHIVVR